MMFGGNRPAAGGAATARKPPIELTLGIDKRTNHLIVSCNETMYRRVESVVQELDRRAKESRPTVRLVELKTADPMVVQATLSSLMPRVTVGATRSKRDKKPTDAQPPGQPQAPDAQMMQRMSDQYNNQPGGGGRGSGGGGRGGGNNGGRRGAN